MISTPLTINQLKIKNRFFKPAMSEQMADKHGNPKASLLSRLYRAWAQGGTGLLLSGNIMVDALILLFTAVIGYAASPLIVKTINGFI